jgi:hypothetical protein
MNRFAAVAIACALLTGLVVGELRSLLTAPVAGTTIAEPRTAHTSAAFYQAMTDVLQTGDPARLRRILHPAFVDHSLGSEEQGSSHDLEAWLLSLRATDPEVRLEAVPLMARDGIAASSLSFALDPSETPQSLRLEVDATGPAYDLLRIENGLVIERWSTASARGPGTIRLASQVEFSAQPVARMAQLERITVRQYSRLDFANTNGAILLAESGAVEAIVTAGQGGAADPAQGALLPGETRTFPAGQSFRLSNTGIEPGVVLMASLRAFDPAVRQPPEPFGAGLPEGVSRELLISGPAASANDGAIRLALHDVALEPGAAIAAHTVPMAELALLIEGELEAAVSEGPVGLLTSAGSIRRTEDPPALQPGQAIIAYAQTQIGYRAGDAAPARLLIITFLDSSDDPAG